MGVRDPRDITEHLKRKDVQERIQKNMQEARSKATVTISRAAKLFNFTESQLREWEKRGLLQTERPSLEGKSSTGHRQYAPAELDKLAIIRELMQGGYSPSEIPPDVDTLWSQIIGEQGVSLLPDLVETLPTRSGEHIPIDKRVEYTDQQEFWRYFVSQTLRLALMLVCEDIPDTVAGLILPLQNNRAAHSIESPFDLEQAGLSLVGWLGKSRSFYTFLDEAPSFEYPSDFRVHPLWVSGEHPARNDIVLDNVLIVVQRKARPLPLSHSLVETFRRLLGLVYRHKEEWQATFDYGPRDWMYQVTDLDSDPTTVDAVLNNLADRVVELGGTTPEGKKRWQFCCILLPISTTLPLQQRSLFVRAQSQNAPHRIGVTTVDVAPGLPVNNISLKAFQSGHVMYRPQITNKDPMIAHLAQEGPVRSAVSIPICGEDGLSVAVLYIASYEEDAFDEEDLRALRIISRMVEESLLTYRARRQVIGKLSALIRKPRIVDMSFQNFLSENELISDIESLLSDIDTCEREGRPLEGEVSFLAIDIDKQSSLANTYGDRVTRNLSKEVGIRALGQRDALFTNLDDRRLYHINADRYYLILKGTPLEVAQTKGERLRQALRGFYRLDVRSSVTERPALPESMLELSDVSVRLGIAFYTYSKLVELLRRYDPEIAVTRMREGITRILDEVLDQGQREGGDVIISWNPKVAGFTRWPPIELQQGGSL